MRSAAASGLQRPRGIDTQPATAAARASARSPPTRRASSRSASRSLTAWTVPCPPARAKRLPGTDDSETKATVATSIPSYASAETPTPLDAPEMRILVVDDEPAVRTSLERALSLEGYEVDLAADGAAALDRLGAAPPHAVIRDVSRPRLDGLEVCRRMRQAGDRTPVLMLTARDAVDDRVEGLDAGADDYLVKPFALKELKARLRALLRRAETPPGADQVLRFADLVLDRGAWEARRGQRPLDLSRTEFQLLAMFLEHPRQVLTRSQIFERVWGYDFGSSSNSLGVYMGYLRRKTEEGGEPRPLHTVRGVGYVLRD